MLNILGIITSVLSKITDTFNRTDGSLGTSSSGNLWSILSGTWAISSNQATSSTAGSSYPLATVDIGAQNVIVSADITDGGPGIAFWVTDANSWWASSVNYSSSVSNTQAYYTGSTVQTGSSCSGAGGNPTTGGGDCGTLVGATSTTTYLTELKLYKNVSGTISTVQTTGINSNSSAFVEANSIKAQTQGDSITITAYQSSGLSSAFATILTNTPSSPLKGTKAGIIKTPSTANAGSLIDNFSAESL